MNKLLFTIVSPTWRIAHESKKGKSSSELRRGLFIRNYGYAVFSLLILIGLGYVALKTSIKEQWAYYILIAVVYFISWSRCNEILIAFIGDALDKTAGKTSSSALTYSERIQLSLVSYLELISAFALIYLIMPSDWFKSEKIESIVDAWYFSGVTITTLGYGDISPSHWLPKVLVIQEVLVGFSLLIVSFAIYAGRGIGNINSQQAIIEDEVRRLKG